MYNCPIVGHYMEDIDDFGGHDMELVEGKDGRLVQVARTEPLGVVPESANYWWEFVTDAGGRHEYLCVEVLLWKRQQGYRKIAENGITNHSMEIGIDRWEEDPDGYMHIQDFTFLAFCLLSNETVEPCFEGSCLTVFSADQFKADYAVMLEELKAQQDNTHPRDDVDKENQKKEEDNAMDKKDLLISYGLNPDTLDFDWQEMSEEELKVKAFDLVSNITGELREKLGVETIETEWGEYPRYCYIDCDLTKNEVYVLDAQDWKLYAMPFAFNGDVIEIAFEEKKRVKTAFVEFDEGTAEQTFSVIAERIQGVAQTRLDESTAAHNEEVQNLTASYEEKITNLTQQLTDAQNEVQVLQEYKQSVEDAQAHADRMAIYEKWFQLGQNEAYVALLAEIDEYTPDEIDCKCKCIYADINASFTRKTNEKKVPVIPVVTPEAHTDDYGGLFTKHGVKPTK